MTDEVLMQRYLQGDQVAFEEIFRRYAPALQRMMLRNNTGGDLARDLVQQTFLQFHRAREDFRSDAKLRPYLYTIAMNLLRSHFRMKGRRPEQSLELDGVPEPRSEAVGTEGIERRETRVKVRRALTALPDKQREVIMLHWFEERPFDEIASIVGASLSAVKVRAHRGYKALRRALDPGESPQ